MSGPWTASVEPHTYAKGKFWYVVLDEEENGLGEFYGDDHEANVANLRMAAAAPDLYEALADAVIGARLPPNVTRSSKVTILATDFHKMRAALAKARGEA